MSHKSEEIHKFLLSEVVNNPKGIVAKAAKHFGVTVQAIQKHIAQLVADGRLIKKGKTRNTIYLLPEELSLSTHKPQVDQTWTVASAEWSFNVDDKLSEQDIWDEQLKGRIEKASQNIVEICEYGFTEMVNNVLDHASASRLTVSYKVVENKLYMRVEDNGMGIFRKLRDSLGLETLREAVLHLSKGKLTTDHTRHTGEGIFFTSRVFDKYSISANGLILAGSTMMRKIGFWVKKLAERLLEQRWRCRLI